MNIDGKRRARFKQNLLAILYLSVIQTWLNFNFPAFTQLGSPLSDLLKVIMSIMFIFGYIMILVFPHDHVRSINLEFLDDFPDPILFKNIFKVLMLIVANATFIYLWYTDFHRVPSKWYFIWYVHSVIALFIIHRSVRSYKNII